MSGRELWFFERSIWLYFFVIGPIVGVSITLFDPDSTKLDFGYLEYFLLLLGIYVLSLTIAYLTVKKTDK